MTSAAAQEAMTEAMAGWIESTPQPYDPETVQAVWEAAWAARGEYDAGLTERVTATYLDAGKLRPASNLIREGAL